MRQLIDDALWALSLISLYLATKVMGLEHIIPEPVAMTGKTYSGVSVIATSFVAGALCLVFSEKRAPTHNRKELALVIAASVTILTGSWCFAQVAPQVENDPFLMSEKAMPFWNLVISAYMTIHAFAVFCFGRVAMNVLRRSRRTAS